MMASLNEKEFTKTWGFVNYDKTFLSEVHYLSKLCTDEINSLNIQTYV